MTAAELLAGLEDGSLPPSRFGHREHVHAAWGCLQNAPLRAAAHRFRDLLRSYTQRLGAEQKFHLTMTLAFMHLIHERLRAGEDWAAFAARNADLFDDARGMIERHYSPAVLAGGRSAFVEPDRAALP